MANKVFEAFKVKQSQPRNGFDTSYRNMFTLPTGALIPFFVKDVNVGDHLKLSATCETRSVQMSSYNFQRCRQHFDYFFVPYRLLWRWWPQFIASTTDYGSALIGSCTTDSDGITTYVNPSVNSYCPFFDTETLSSFLSDGRVGDNGLWVNETDQLGYSLVEGFKRIAFALGLDARSFMYCAVDVCDKHAITPFRILAYQKIYQDFYRNTDYESENPFAFNVDFKKPDTTVNNMRIYTTQYNPDMFMLRYALYNRDQVTYIKPSVASSYIGSLSFAGNSNAIHYNGITPFNRQHVISSTGQGAYINTEIGVNSTTGATSSDGTYVFTASDNRLNSALDKMTRIQMMAEKRYSSQIEAHFGESVNKRDDNRCRRLGSSFINIGTQEVTSTADSGNAGVGSIGAKGYGKDTTKVVSFDAEEHGVVIGLTYIEPLIDYLQNFEDPFFTKLTRTAYFTPELDGLGLQPVYARNVQTMSYDKVLGSYATTTLGYQPRYMEYKSARDVVSPSFKDAYPTWVAPREDVYTSYDEVSVNNGTWFHIAPNILDDIFYSAYNGKPATDQFQCCVNNNVLYVTNMSVTGLPRL